MKFTQVKQQGETTRDTATANSTNHHHIHVNQSHTEIYTVRLICYLVNLDIETR